MNRILIPYRRKDDKWGFCNDEKKLIIPCIYESVRCFQEGRAAVMKGGLWGAISEDGQEIIPCIHEPSKKINPLMFSEGLAVFSVQEKYGYLDPFGNVVIPPTYEFGGWFTEGLACVSKNYLKGFINTSGELVINYRYDDVTSFENGISIVFYRNKRGFINKNGVEFWEE